MIDLATLCNRFGIEAAAARQALAAGDGADHDTPWYAEAVLGAGGWFSAIAIIVFTVAFLSLVVGIEEPGIEAVIAGLVLFGTGTAWIARARGGLFATHFAIAMTAAGAGLATGGTGFQTESLWAATAMSAMLAGIGTAAARNVVLQFLLAALAALLLIIGLEKDVGRGAVDAVALATPIGLWLTLRPPQLNLRPIASVLLLATPFAAAVLEAPGLSWTAPEGWVARLVHLALFLALIVIRRRADEVRPGPAAIAAALLAMLVALLLPAGIAGALFLMMLAYTIGHRPYAVIGAGLALWFIWNFYYELGIALLDKSLMLVAAGLGCLALHAALSVRRPA